MKRIFQGIVLLAIAVPAAAENFDSNGYALRLSVRQLEQRVVVDGRLEGGAPCALLRLEIRLRNAAGTSKQIKIKVKEAGDFYSRLIEGSVTVKNAPTSWSIDGVVARCERP